MVSRGRGILYIAEFPPRPIITNTSFESNSIAIYWQSNDAIEYYRIRYNFVIRECTSEASMSTQSRQVNTTNKSNIILNSLNNEIEEDSDYNISLIAINSTQKSQAIMIMNATKEAGTHMLNQILYY
jgi:hypothetical protein